MFNPCPAATAVCPSRKAKGQWGDSVRFLPAGLLASRRKDTEHVSRHHRRTRAAFPHANGGELLPSSGYAKPSKLFPTSSAALT